MCLQLHNMDYRTKILLRKICYEHVKRNTQTYHCAQCPDNNSRAFHYQANNYILSFQQTVTLR
jgi:hypothetical protein